MDYIKVGKIINTHGIKGELKLQLLTDFPSRFEEEIAFYIGEGGTEVHIEKSRFHKGVMILAFKEFDSINQVEKYKGEFLFVHKDNRVELPEDTYYIDDLVGFRVVEEGKEIGILKAIQTDYGNDVYIVKTNKGDVSIPGVKEFILKVDLDQKEIQVKLIEGMME